MKARIPAVKRLSKLDCHDHVDKAEWDRQRFYGEDE